MLKKLICMTSLLLLTACENAPFNIAELQSTSSLTIGTSISDKNSISESQRKKQQEVIELAFARRTSPERARILAEICFNKTIDTVFMPFDLAEIALVETGGHHLSSRAVSVKGAIGVWQLMPARARSHGYLPKDMLDDQKCAEAAVRELYTKLGIAHGNLENAKKYYCGRGLQAITYMKKIRSIRREMVAELNLIRNKVASAEGNI